MIPLGDLVRQVGLVASAIGVTRRGGEVCATCGDEVAWNQKGDRLHHFDPSASLDHRPVVALGGKDLW